MSKTVRVRDEDADRIQVVRDLTGLSTAEAVHYLFRVRVTSDQDLYEDVRANVARKASLHPEWDPDNPDKNQLLVNQVEFDSAETLLNDTAMPRFSPHHSPEIDP
jgi:hypothetical protein